MTVFAAVRVFGADVPDDRPAWVEVEGDRVVATGTGRRDGAEDLGDACLAPAYLDVQLNGLGRVDFATAPADDCAALFAALRARGIGGCCPTLCTAPLDAYAPMLERFAFFVDDPMFLGLHLEGPFLGDAPGAHPVDLVRPVDLDWLRDLLDRFPGLVRIVTLAPEADAKQEATRLLVERGVTVALGHSRVSYDDARGFADAGARIVTHLFNGMGPLHHRAPGLPGAALDDARLVPSLIGDGVHVHPALVRLATAVRPDLVLVSDAVATGGTAARDGGGAAYLADGTLAGATIAIDDAVANLVAFGVPGATAVATATANPARVLGLRGRGRLVAGARADVNVLRPAELRVRGLLPSGS